MSEEIQYTPYHHGDVAKQMLVGGLRTLREQGTYHVIFHQMLTGDGTLPIEESLLFRLVGAITDEEKELVRDVLARPGLFDRDGDVYRNKLVDRQRDLASGNIRQGVAGGKARAAGAAREGGRFAPAGRAQIPAGPQEPAAEPDEAFADLPALVASRSQSASGSGMAKALARSSKAYSQVDRRFLDDVAQGRIRMTRQDLGLED
jgi:hypothetical protein